MTMRTQIEELVAGAPAEDNWGNDVPANAAWRIKVPNVACWLYTRTERETIGPNDTKVVEDLKLLLPLRTDVRETDRLRDVKGRDGSLVRPGLLAIEAVVNLHTHIELTVRGIA
jgi:hypothetical protein